MPLWRPLTILACMAALAGCSDGSGGGGFGMSRKAPDTMAVAGGAVVVAGPDGYCIDRAGSRQAGDSAFVLLASCASITQDPDSPVPDAAGLLTASVAGPTGAAPATEAALDQLARFIETEAGRATLARDGRPESVEVLDIWRDPGAILLRLRDSSANTTPGLDDTYWRALLDLNGHLVTLSVMSFAQQPLGNDAGLATLRNFVDRIRSRAPKPGEAPAPRKSLFLGLFN